jgi:GT2 family glycosyltransferase
MPALRRFELDELLVRPGSYYNPDTGILLVVDDSSAVDADVFEEEGGGDSEWVLLADDVPVDEQARDELIERFEVRHHGGASGAVPADEDDEDVLDDELEPDDDVEEL